jgi:hypothetical protein
LASAGCGSVAVLPRAWYAAGPDTRSLIARLTVPGPSFVRDETVALRSGEKMSVGLTAPSVMEDGWWLTHLWVADDEGVVQAMAVAPAAGPPPGTPLEALGPRLAGALSGLISEDGGRQQIRLRMPPAEDGRGRGSGPCCSCSPCAGTRFAP